MILDRQAFPLWTLRGVCENTDRLYKNIDSIDVFIDFTECLRSIELDWQGRLQFYASPF